MKVDCWRAAAGATVQPARKRPTKEDDWQCHEQAKPLKNQLPFGLIVGTGGGPQGRTNSGSGWTLARALVGLRVGIAGDRGHKSCRDGQPEGKAWKVTACALAHPKGGTAYGIPYNIIKPMPCAGPGWRLTCCPGWPAHRFSCESVD
jgi:hypothetical protein